MEELMRVTALRETAEGDGVCDIEGKVLFVRGMMAGEEGLARMTEEGKRFSKGELCTLKVKSPDRREASCPHYASCGGCSWLHAAREHELAVKTRRVGECLTRIGGFEEGSYQLFPAVGGNEAHYRGKSEFRAENGRFGYTSRTGGFVPAEDCLLIAKEANNILEILKNANLKSLAGCVMRTNFKGETMLVLSAKGKLPPLPEKELRAEGVVSLWKLTPKERMTHALDGRLERVWGVERLEEEICGLKFALSPRAFFQINREIAEKLYLKAVELAGIGKEDTVLDAYAGVGAIGMTAAKKAKKVYSVEVIPEAVEDAKRAAEENDIGNIECIAGKCEEILPKDPRFHALDAVFLDPPRKGCDKKLLDAVTASGAKKIVYVSCDPATLARDAAYLREKGYQLISASPYDMFAKAGHVETIVLLSKKEE